ncbi:hypothetical protein KJ765_01350 [Candidatus Micrarchaeota archaeon]|nr:hypothetical protein [Candidatus Micrarchaeota archaeon]
MSCLFERGLLHKKDFAALRPQFLELNRKGVNLARLVKGIREGRIGLGMIRDHPAIPTEKQRALGESLEPLSQAIGSAYDHHIGGYAFAGVPREMPAITQYLRRKNVPPVIRGMVGDHIHEFLFWMRITPSLLERNPRFLDQLGKPGTRLSDEQLAIGLRNFTRAKSLNLTHYNILSGFLDRSTLSK